MVLLWDSRPLVPKRRWIDKFPRWCRVKSATDGGGGGILHVGVCAKSYIFHPFLQPPLVLHWQFAQACALNEVVKGQDDFSLIREVCPDCAAECGGPSTVPREWGILGPWRRSNCILYMCLLRICCATSNPSKMG